MTRREVLELITAILLGLVSVATAFGAYQATVWHREASDLASVSEQLRSRNLTETLSSQLTLQDDTRRVAEAFTLQTDAILDPARAAEVATRQEQLLAAASPSLQQAWAPWAESGYSPELLPLGDADYSVSLFALPQSLQYASFEADGMVDRISERADRLTGAAILFAISLFVLGVGGVLRSWRGALALAISGAVLLIVGLIVTATAY
jgi:hypothetical protein